MLSAVHEHPLRSLFALMGLTFSIQVVVDAVMGHAAEYFSASNLLLALGARLTGGDPAAYAFLIGQEAMGIDVALLVATGFAIGQHVLFAGLFLFLLRHLPVAAKK